MKRFFLIISLLLMLSFGISEFAFSTMAKDADVPEQDVYYTCIKIQYGDTLDSLADEYNKSDYLSREDYKKSIRNINGLKQDNLYPGCYLTLAIYE